MKRSSWRWAFLAPQKRWKTTQCLHCAGVAAYFCCMMNRPAIIIPTTLPMLCQAFYAPSTVSSSSSSSSSFVSNSRRRHHTYSSTCTNRVRHLPPYRSLSRRFESTVPNGDSSYSNTTATTTLPLCPDEDTRNDDDEFNITPPSVLSISLTEQQIREAYQEGETDGILELVASTTNQLDLNPSELIRMSLQATNNNKGQAAGIINAFIASTTTNNNSSNTVNTALQWLEAYDAMADEYQLYPDVVTLSLVYTALVREKTSSESTANKDERINTSDDSEYLSSMAMSVLERAARWSKKMGGSKRRKALAASRRRPASDSDTTNCMDVQEDLRAILGTDFAVLHESDDLLVLSKPSGVVCYHKRKTTAGRIHKKRKTKKNKSSDDSGNDTAGDVSLEDALLHYNIPLSTLNADGRGMVHRIDRGTSGCMVLAKTDDMHARLVSEFFLRRVQKTYRALVVNGEYKKMDDGWNPSEGILESLVQGRPARSAYSVLERYYCGNHEEEDGAIESCLLSLLRVETFTGRKHQVRIHCAEGLQTPILFDPLYGYHGRKKDGISVQLPPKLKKLVADATTDKRQRFCLHSSELSIPKYGVTVQAPYPTWWERDVLSELKKR